MSEQLEIRNARPGDVRAIFSLVCELADYERARDKVKGSPELLAAALFGDHRYAESLVAVRRAEVVGFALFYPTFSTWECRPGIWLEDLYVRPQHRRDGVGQSLLGQVAAIALERGCARLEWAALSWNTPALNFYAKLGAQRLDEWVMLRLQAGQLDEVALAAG